VFIEHIQNGAAIYVVKMTQS